MRHKRTFTYSQDLRRRSRRRRLTPYTHTLAHISRVLRSDLTMSWWKAACLWQPVRGKMEVGDRERRCHRDRDGPPPHNWRTQQHV